MQTAPRVATRPAPPAPRRSGVARVTPAPARPARVARAVSTDNPKLDEAAATASAGSAPAFRSPATGRPRVVVVGSGWGAISFLKALPRDVADRVDVTIISPRNYFLYTPLLPAVATGTVEERSIVEPVRKLLANKGQYWEAVVHSIDPATKEIVACFPKDSGLDEACFKVDYDVLVLAVGCTTNTFGVKGVEEHAFFFKSIDDAASLRRHVSECFERAALPQTPPEEKDKLLSFVVCGGGPTGVEVAAELHDMVTEDLVKLYPTLTPHVRVRIIELQDHLLSTYDRAISEYTGKQFARAGIDTILGARVLEVIGEGTGKGYVRVQGADGQQTDISFGACVWATGVAMHPLVKQLASKLPAGTQTHFRSAVTNGYLEVDGSDGSIFALGDAATLRQDRALDAAAALFDRADVDKNGALDLDELRALLATASDKFPQFKEHAKFLDSKRGFARWGGMVGSALERARTRAAGAASDNPLSTLDDDTALTREEFAELLGSIDRGLRALPATAQVAKQQGEYLAKLVAAGHVTGAAPVEQLASSKGASPPPPFTYCHKGSLAYVGQDKAVMDVPVVGPLFGATAGLAWRSFETVSQISPRNMVLVSLDWLRTRVFGRDISRV